MRKRIIQVGVGVLLLAFMFTSGIVCVNMGAQQRQAQQQQDQPKQSQLTYWREQAAKDPSNTEAIANVGHFLMMEAASKPEGEERNKLVAEAEQNLNKVIAMQNDSNRSFALQEMARVQMFKEDWSAAQATLDEALRYADRPIPEGQEPEAQTAMREARNAEKAADLMLLAQLQAAQHKFPESLATLDKLAELNPPNGMDVLFMRAGLYNELGEKQKALAQLDMAEKLAASQEDQIRVMIMKQQLLAPPPSNSPSAAPSPAVSPEAPPSPVSAVPTPTSPSPATTVASPAPPSASPAAPGPAASPSAAPSP